MLQRSLLLSLTPVLLLFGGAAPTVASDLPEWGNWVLKIEVIRNDGRKEFGSAVLIGPERLLTNCHVLRNASRIQVSDGKETWPASADVGDAFRDLCLLKLPEHPGEAPRHR